MRIDIVFHYEINEHTGEMQYLGKEEIKVDTGIKKQTVEDDGSPKITLQQNKLILSSKAIELLKVVVGDKIDIKYQTEDNVTRPVIGCSRIFGTNTGNKLTKSNTVSFKGAANESLQKYGEEFILEQTEIDNLYYLVSTKEIPAEPIPEEIIDIDKELEVLNLLDDFNIEKDECELDKFNFIL